MRVKRSTGITSSERFLARMCEQCFLSLWSYPNLFNDKGGAGSASGQELCDLLVVFGNDVLIFSDKSCEYPSGSDELVNWRRWYKRAIRKSADQIAGAERWIIHHPDRIYLDQACSRRLPISIPPRDRIRIHRIMVATGAVGERDVPGLRLQPSVVGDVMPTTIGQILDAGKFVHVLDEVSLSSVLMELSTTADLVDYFCSKEAWIVSGGLRSAECELDLLAYYLWNARTFPSSASPMSVPGGEWERLVSSRAYASKWIADEQSFFWDRLIELFNRNYNEESLESGNDISIIDYESALRFMAAESRLSRRVLSDAIIERMHRAVDGWVASILSSENPEVTYVLLVGPGTDKSSHADYRMYRSAILDFRCQVAKIIRPEIRWVVGLAVDAMGAVGSSENIIVLDTKDWGPSEFAQAKSIQHKYKFFLPERYELIKQHEWEYPEIKR